MEPYTKNYMHYIIKLTLFIAILFFGAVWLSSYSKLGGYNNESTHIASGVIKDKNLQESSGLAISTLNPNTLWSHNDSGNTPSLIAFDLQGQFRAKVDVKGIKNIDWEDLAAFKYNGENYLIVADTGDNHAQRDEYFLHIIREPLLTKKHYLDPIIVTPDWSISYIYADEARDCESVAVDTVNEKILLLSKREQQPILFELPLQSNESNHHKLISNKQQIATRLGTIPSFPKPTDPEFSLIDLLGYSTQPTAMDISTDGRFIAVLTYDSAFVFETNGSTDWLSILSSLPTRYQLPSLKQAESLAFGTNSDSLYITTEKLPAPIIEIPIKL